jgi:hypothetical protein
LRKPTGAPEIRVAVDRPYLLRAPNVAKVQILEAAVEDGMADAKRQRTTSVSIAERKVIFPETVKSLKRRMIRINRNRHTQRTLPLKIFAI